MFENFERTVTDLSTFTDDQVETFFWILAKEVPEKINTALKLLEAHRNELAKKIARIFLETYIEEPV
jgi:hypothetical protein